eukprot:4516334-Pleurochrysis_carterae.AAC.1
MSDASPFVVHVDGPHAALVEVSGQVPVPLDAAAQVRCYYCCGLPPTAQDAICNCAFAVVAFVCTCRLLR